jgi:hypothetical protein
MLGQGTEEMKSSFFTRLIDLVWEVLGGGVLFLVILLFLLFFVRNNAPAVIFTSPIAIGFMGIALLVELYLLYALFRTLQQKYSRKAPQIFARQEKSESPPRSPRNG